MNIFHLIPKDLDLRTKLIIVIFSIFLGGFLVSSLTYYNVLLGNAKHDLDIRSNLLISTMDSVRKYNSDEISPLLRDTSPEKLLIQSVPDAAVKNIFKILTKVYKENYGDYRYKNAMYNPTNLSDLATDEEQKIIEILSRQEKQNLNPEKNIAQGFIVEDGIKKYFTARPIIITDKACLTCHTSLEKAPKSLKVLYSEGKYQGNAGFDWELNQVIGAKMMYIPAEKVYQSAKQKFVLMVGIFIAIYTAAILFVSLWLRQYVVRPINRITQAATELSLGDLAVDFEKESNDEVGRLAEAFMRLKTSLVIAMRRLER